MGKKYHVIGETENVNSGSGFSLTRSYVYGSYVNDVIAKFENDTKFLQKDRQFSVKGLSNGSAAM